ncbi:MAG: hypothetical protein K9L17_11540 [Clostridiales bacterium]|nr:hypothetical protein [Clostridiales bacterium]
MQNIEKRVWAELARNKKGKWSKKLEKAFPERYTQLKLYVRRGCYVWPA